MSFETDNASNITGQVAEFFAESCEHGNRKNSDCVFGRVLYHILTPLLYGLITLSGLLGNAMVIYVITSRRKMWNLTNLMLLNLAVADACFLLVCPPFTALHFATLNWPFGELACQLMHCATNVTVYVTVYTLVLICVVRYLAIVHNYSTARYRTKRNVVLVITSMWICMICVAVPFGKVFGLVRHPHDESTYCLVKDLQHGRLTFTFSCIFAYFLPLLIIGALSLALLGYIRGSQSRDVPLRSTAPRRGKQAGWVIRLVVVAFVVLWLPTNIDLLVFYYSCPAGPASCPQPDRWQHVLQVLARCMAYSNSCINPLIYNFASKEFRHHFCEVIHCRRDRAQPRSTMATCTGTPAT